MDSFDQYARAENRRLTADIFSKEVLDKEAEAIISANEFFDYQVDGEAKLLAVAPHAEDPLHTCRFFNEYQGKLLPKNGDSAQWLKLVRLTSDTQLPNIMRIDNADELTHVSLAPGSAEHTVRVLLERRGPCTPDIFAAYCKLYKLTKAESSVVWQLTQGFEPKRIAINNAVAVSTVRTQIKTALLKTEEASIRTMLLRVSSIGYGHLAQNGRPGPGVRRGAQ